MRRLVAITLLAALSACATQYPTVSLRPREALVPDDYESVLGNWTRHDRVYHMLESKLFVYATFHSPEFRKAFLLRHTDVYGRGSAVAQRLALTAPDADEAIEFFFSASTNEPTWNDFHEDDSIWRVTLTGDGGEEVDGTVTRLKTTANLRVIYPFISDFARTYAVRFPRTDGSGKPVISSRTTGFQLRLVSAIGEAILRWDLQPSGSPRPKS